MSSTLQRQYSELMDDDSSMIISRTQSNNELGQYLHFNGSQDSVRLPDFDSLNNLYSTTASITPTEVLSNNNNNNNNNNNIYNNYANPDLFTNASSNGTVSNDLYNSLNDYMYNNNRSNSQNSINNMNNSNNDSYNFSINPTDFMLNEKEYIQHDYYQNQDQNQNAADNVLLISQDDYFNNVLDSTQQIINQQQLLAAQLEKSLSQSNELNIFKTSDLIQETYNQESDDDELDDEDEEDNNYYDDEDLMDMDMDMNDDNSSYSDNTIGGTTSNSRLGSRSASNTTVTSNQNTQDIVDVINDKDVEEMIRFSELEDSQLMLQNEINLNNVDDINDNSIYSLTTPKQINNSNNLGRFTSLSGNNFNLDLENDIAIDDEYDVGNESDASDDIYTPAFERRESIIDSIRPSFLQNVIPSTHLDILNQHNQVDNYRHHHQQQHHNPRSHRDESSKLRKVKSNERENAEFEKELNQKEEEFIRENKAHLSVKSGGDIDSKTNHTCQIIDKRTGQICGKTFSRPYDLTRHELIHSPKRGNYVCIFCKDDELRKQGLDPENSIVKKFNYRNTELSRFNGSGNLKKKGGTFGRVDALTRHLRNKHGLTESQAVEPTEYAKEHIIYYLNE